MKYRRLVFDHRPLCCESKLFLNGLKFDRHGWVCRRKPKTENLLYFVVTICSKSPTNKKPRSFMIVWLLGTSLSISWPPIRCTYPMFAKNGMARTYLYSFLIWIDTHTQRVWFKRAMHPAKDPTWLGYRIAGKFIVVLLQQLSMT